VPHSDSPAPSPTSLTPDELVLLSRAIWLAQQARTHGNHPFGALLATPDGTTFEAENTVLTTGDPTCHAETNLVRMVSVALSPAERRASTLYTSTEPCAMCAGAIYWSGVGRVVYALPEQELLAMVPRDADEPTMDLPCRDVFAAGGNTVQVVGPALLEAARAVHAGFWASLP
jgi:tRNA(Arg) A34 adenosine deaminase TadA